MGYLIYNELDHQFKKKLFFKAKCLYKIEFLLIKG